MANILPFSEKYYKQWWGNFWKWAFMGPAITFMLWLSTSFLDGYYNARFKNTTGGAGTLNSVAEGWTWLIAAAVMLWLAANLPLKMGSEIYGAINNAKNKAWSNKHNPIKNRLDMFKNNRDAARNMKLREKQAKLATGKFGFMTGMNQKQRAAERAGLMGDIQKEYGGMGINDVQTIAEGKGIRAEAAQDYLAGIGKLDVSKNAEFANRMHQRSMGDNAFGGKLADKQKDFAAQVALATGGSNTKAVEDTIKMIREGNAADLKVAHFQAAIEHGGVAGAKAVNLMAADQGRSDQFNKATKGDGKAAFGFAAKKAETVLGGSAQGSSGAAREAKKTHEMSVDVIDPSTGKPKGNPW
jgi:hypothetical protein